MAKEAGIYITGPDGRETLLLAYMGGDYQLQDLPDFFAAGKLFDWEDGAPGLEVTGQEARQIKVQADAHSFDFDEELIELCYALERATAGDGLLLYRLRQSF
ncbi:MAG: hypothetical protein WD489_08780 [Rhodovibrionaceae bacterium]